MKSVKGWNKLSQGTQNNQPVLMSQEFDRIDSVNYADFFTENYGFPKEWYGENLPHRNQKNLVQFLTFRLADSLPQNVLEEIAQKIKFLSREKKNAEKRIQYQNWLDRGLGCCALAKRAMAEEVQDALQFHDGQKYDLLVWSIMPNHVHVLIWAKHDLSKILQSWKSYTGRWGLAHNKEFQLGLEPDATAFWMSDYWDRFIRNEEHFNNTVRYILNNPKKAGLPRDHIAYEFRGCNLV